MQIQYIDEIEKAAVEMENEGLCPPSYSPIKNLSGLIVDFLCGDAPVDYLVVYGRYSRARAYRAIRWMEDNLSHIAVD